MNTFLTAPSTRLMYLILGCLTKSKSAVPTSWPLLKRIYSPFGRCWFKVLWTSTSHCFLQLTYTKLRYQPYGRIRAHYLLRCELNHLLKPHGDDIWINRTSIGKEPRSKGFSWRLTVEIV